jgi:Mce-associated membrane protein
MTTRLRILALGVTAALLLGLILWEGWYVWLRDDPQPTAERPVTVSDLVEATAVDTAQKSTAEILSTSYQDYDAQATQAKALMTDTFAAKYGETSADIKTAFIEAKTTVTFTVAWAGVYRASKDQVQALLFLDQVVTKGGGGPTTTPYRALVTVVPSDRGWLVADIQTR